MTDATTAEAGCIVPAPAQMGYCRLPPGGTCIRSPVYSAWGALESVLPEARGCNFSFIPANFL